MSIDYAPVSYLTTPAPLEGVKGGYALYVVGDAMHPEFRAGDVALVHPYLPQVLHTAHIFYDRAQPGKDLREPTLGMIRNLTRITETEWHVERWTPHRTTTVKRADWPTAHRIVGKFR